MTEKLPEISFYPDTNGRGIPVIGVRLLSAEPLQPKNICRICDGNDIEIIQGPQEWPYREEGFIVRFDDLPEYFCNGCGIRTTSTTIASSMEITLNFILKRLKNKPTQQLPLEEIQKMLSRPIEES